MVLVKSPSWFDVATRRQVEPGDLRREQVLGRRIFGAVEQLLAVDDLKHAVGIDAVAEEHAVALRAGRDRAVQRDRHRAARAGLLADQAEVADEDRLGRVAHVPDLVRLVAEGAQHVELALVGLGQILSVLLKAVQEKSIGVAFALSKDLPHATPYDDLIARAGIEVMPGHDRVLTGKEQQALRDMLAALDTLAQAREKPLTFRAVPKPDLRVRPPM